jgi:hypothetical protein
MITEVFSPDVWRFWGGAMAKNLVEFEDWSWIFLARIFSFSF